MRTLLDRLQYRVLTPAGAHVALPVGAAATTLAVVFARAEGTATYGVHVTPSWLTTVACTAKTTTGCTLAFGTAPGGSGGTVDVFTTHDDR